MHNILPVIMGYPGAVYCSGERFEFHEKQLPYPEWYKDKFVAPGLYASKYNSCTAQIQRDAWEKKATAVWNWRNHDLRMVDWYQGRLSTSDGQKVIAPYTHFLFLEPDVFMPTQVTKEWINASLKPEKNTVLVPRSFQETELIHYKFWNDAEKFGSDLTDLRSHIRCVPPLSCILIPIGAMDELSWLRRQTDVFEKDVLSEVRMPTLLHFLGYRLVKEPLFDGVRCFPKPLRSDRTPFFHPYKIKPL